jgi:hypothetical protein
MRRLLFSPPRLCRECLLRSFRQITTASDAPTAPKPVPLRIFATEADSNAGGRSSGLAAEFAPSDVSAATRHHRTPDTVPARAPPAERLNSDFKSRVGPPRRRSAFQSPNSKRDPEPRVRISSRVPAYLPEVSNPATPTDLLQPPEGLETDTLLTAIDGCLSAAMVRLELSSSDTNSQPRSPGKTCIPYDQYMWLCNILRFQFNKPQLVQYGQKYGLGKNRLMREKTEVVIRTILDNLWNLEMEPELPPDEALITKSTLSS